MYSRSKRPYESKFPSASRSLLGLMVVVGLTVIVGLARAVTADDWPAWRHDAHRSAVTAEALPPQLRLHWTRKLGANHVAWGEDPRIQFDASYEPIVVGKQVIVASARDHSVSAFHLDSGDVTWKYPLAVPVRLAPFAHNGRVYFGADDGRLHCLDLQTGAPLWTLNAAPSDRLILGNERLISVWPARGGVVIFNDAAYFTVGVWPFEGCLLCKVDLTNDSPQLESRLLDDVSPQGHLAVVAGRVLVPGGRGLVTGYDAETLEPRGHSYSPGRGTTETHVASGGDAFFHGDAIYDFKIGQALNIKFKRPLADGRRLYAISSANAPKPQKGRVHSVVAYDLDDRRKIVEKDRRGKEVTRFEVTQQWSGTLPDFAEATADAPRLLAKAGDDLLGIWGDHVFAVNVGDAAVADLEESAVLKLTWQRRFDSPTSVLFANQKLLVVTAAGELHCLGENERVARAHPPERGSNIESARWSQRVTEILDGVASQRGHCVVLGASEPALIQELLTQSRYYLHIVEPDAEKAQAARRQLAQLGAYGPRATVTVADPRRLALPPYMAQLIVAEDAERFGPADAVTRRFYHVLRPYGGMLAFGSGEPVVAKVEAVAEKLPGAAVKATDRFVGVKKVGALPGAADWTHEYGDPSNTLMSQDRLVKAPFGLLWFGGPASHGELFYNRHYWGPGLTVVDGRMVVQGPQTLASIDIYTGELLWKKEIRDGSGPGRRGTFFEKAKPGYHFAVTEDAVYLVYHDVCLVLDPETGETKSELRMPIAGDQWGKIRIWQDYLIVAVFRETESGMLPRAVRCLDRHSGKILWSQDAQQSFPLIAVGGDKVYCFDGYLLGLYDAWRRKGVTPKSEGVRSMRAFELATGDESWIRTAERVASWMAYSPEHDTLVVSNKEGFDAIQGKDGSDLWKKDNKAPGFGGHPEGVWDKVILSGDRIIDQRGPGKSYDIRTGKPIVHLNPISFEQEEWEFTKTGHHCNYAIASPHLLTFRAGTAGFFDRATNTTGRLNGFRSGCRNSLIPAGGVLNAPNYAHGCSCNYNLFTSLALVHLPQADLWTYSAYNSPAETISRIGINLGAPGDRMSDDGTLWLEYPPARDPSPKVAVTAEGSVRTVRVHSSKVEGRDPWIGGSATVGVKALKVTVDKPSSEKHYDVALYFSEPEFTAAGKRQFDVKVQGQTVLTAFDPYAASGSDNKLVIHPVKGVAAKEGSILIELVPVTGETLLSGIRLEEVTPDK